MKTDQQQTFCRVSDACSHHAFLADAAGFDVAVIRRLSPEDIIGDEPEAVEAREALLSGKQWQSLIDLVNAVPDLLAALVACRDELAMPNGEAAACIEAAELAIYKTTQ